MDTSQFLYRLNGYLLLQKSLDPVGRTEGDPSAGIFERDLFAKGFSAFLTPISVYEEAAFLDCIAPNRNIFQPHLVVFVDMYFTATYRTAYAFRLYCALKKQNSFVFVRANPEMCAAKSLTFELDFDII